MYQRQFALLHLVDCWSIQRMQKVYVNIVQLTEAAKRAKRMKEPPCILRFETEKALAEWTRTVSHEKCFNLEEAKENLMLKACLINIRLALIQARKRALAKPKQ